MKKRLPLWVTLFVACSMMAAPGASTLLAKGGPPAWAGDRDKHDRGEHDRGEHRGQYKKWNRERDGRYRFDDDDRRRVDVYFRDHRDEYREHWRRYDDDAPRVSFGYVIGRPYRQYCEPVPGYLYQELPPPPPGYRYFLYYGNVVLVDDDYRVQDFIHVDLNFGR